MRQNDNSNSSSRSSDGDYCAKEMRKNGEREEDAVERMRVRERKRTEEDQVAVIVFV